jgi:hypothetical protein
MGLEQSFRESASRAGAPPPGAFRPPRRDGILDMVLGLLVTLFFKTLERCRRR